MEALDSTSVKKLVANFEKALTKNQLQRTKFADQPEKFMESELELDGEIKRLQGIATTPTLYPELLKFNTHVSLLALVTHENADISVDAVEVIRELTDGEPLEESPETVTALVHALVCPSASALESFLFLLPFQGTFCSELKLSEVSRPKRTWGCSSTGRRDSSTP